MTGRSEKYTAVLYKEANPRRLAGPRPAILRISRLSPETIGYVRQTSNVHARDSRTCEPPVFALIVYWTLLATIKGSRQR